MVAFPEELRSLWPPLELYLKAIFTDSTATEKLFFRGLYLTSGLQAGVPIAKACAALISGNREADTRALEALFIKQRAYFIKELVRERVFGERGLVRRRRDWKGRGEGR
jgi:type VI protein secretion system component VasK